MHSHPVTDNSAEQRYEMDLGDELAVVEYDRAPGLVILSHTYVPVQHEGRGIGSELARAVLEDIRRQGLQVLPACSFMAHYIFRHPEWEELLYQEQFFD